MLSIDFDHRPHGVEPLAKEPEFNPARHIRFRQIDHELMGVKGKIRHALNVSLTPWRVNYPKG